MSATVSAPPEPAETVGAPSGGAATAGLGSSRHHEPANAEKRVVPWH